MICTMITMGAEEKIESKKLVIRKPEKSYKGYICYNNSINYLLFNNYNNVFIFFNPCNCIMGNRGRRY